MAYPVSERRRLEVLGELSGDREQRVACKVVLPGVVVDRLPAPVLEILCPALEQERLPGPPAAIDADDERRLLASEDARQAIRDLLAVEYVVAPRVLRFDLGLDDLEGG